MGREGGWGIGGRICVWVLCVVYGVCCVVVWCVVCGVVVCGVVVCMVRCMNGGVYEWWSV